MDSIILKSSKNIKVSEVGGKAYSLFLLEETDLNIPHWLVIPDSYLKKLLPQHEDDNESIYESIENISIPESLIYDILSKFPPKTLFAVRSSGGEEDGSKFSFAGQFESVLFVNPENLSESIKSVWRSAYSNRVKGYRSTNNLTSEFNFAIIIQEMIDADVAGVAFGINPVNGRRNEKLISAAFGIGEGLVSGELNADNYFVKNGNITAEISHKTHKFIHNDSNEKNIKKVSLELSQTTAGCLSETQIQEIADVLDQCYRIFGRPQDVEFAIFRSKLYILQSRPITSLDKIADPGGEQILWDNSNIIESYPGVTTPLTFSFITKSYEEAYKLFSEFLGVPIATIKKHERVFSNTLGFINGRVYYNLKTWYHMLAMLPGYSINARYMEKMMGVKEQFDIPEDYKLSKSAAWWNIIKIAFKMIRRYFTLPRQRRKFNDLLHRTITEYKNIDFQDKSINELMSLYLQFEKKLLQEWKAPLLNDFFAMIWFGLLQSQCKKINIPDNKNIHNDLLCGSSDIISTQPIHRTIEISTLISRDPELKNLFTNEDEISIWKIISGNSSKNYQNLKSEIDLYLKDFGERCVGELKLETISYSQDPRKFVKILKSYVTNNITVTKTLGNIEEKIRTGAEKEVKKALRGKFFKQWMFNKILSNARDLVSARENLRYERTRAFGIVREIFSQMGRKFYSERIIDNSRDIFFLTKEEIFSYIEGTSVTQNILALIDLRKKEFEKFNTAPIPSERFPTYGPVYHANNFYFQDKSFNSDAQMKGIGCCPGIIKGRVRVVLKPDEINSLDGDILVTSSTDPGWVTLFPTASGIIVERGSLLSHSAIVSREMGIPCIVGVTGLLNTLKTGDEIEMNGGTGEIIILNS